MGESRICKDGYLYFGIPGSCTALLGAMAFASSEIVQLLLADGADSHATEITGNNALMGACVFNRLDNVKFWMKEFPHWDLNASDTAIGSVALGHAIYMGSNRLELVKFLIENGACVTSLGHHGGTMLSAACTSEDSDPDVVSYLLQNNTVKSRLLNYRQKARTMKWRFFFCNIKDT